MTRRESASGLPNVCAGLQPDDAIWKTRAHWRAVWLIVGRLLDQMDEPSRDGLEQAAGEVKAACETLFPILDQLGEATCPFCERPCCQVADPRFDLRDILLIHLAAPAVPMGQPRGEGHAACRYLGPEGCILPRLARPWICAWYLCPGQKRRLLSRCPGERERLEAAVKEVKLKRRVLEDRFIEAQAADPGG